MNMKKKYILPLFGLLVLGHEVQPPFALIAQAESIQTWARNTTSTLGSLIKTSSKKYTQEITYASPGGTPKVVFSVNTNSKWIITSVDIVNKESDPGSSIYIKRFGNDIRKKVIGKNIKTLTLNVVGGASLTTRAFGEFLIQIGASSTLVSTLPTPSLPITSSGGISPQKIVQKKEIQIPKIIEKTLAYTSPGGKPKVQFHIETNKEGTITIFRGKTLQADKWSRQYIERFFTESGKNIVGKNIRTLSVSTIGGASLTTGAFETLIQPYKTKIETYNLWLTVSGSGKIQYGTGDVFCSGNCTYTLASWSTIQLRAIADTGSVFSGWIGSGIAQSGATLSIDSLWKDFDIQALFIPQKTQTIVYSGGGGWGGGSSVSVPTVSQYPLSLTVVGNGMVTSNPAGINCGTTCTSSYAAGTSITLTATPTSGNTFSGWSAGCTGSSTTCTLPLNQASSVTATFVADTPTDTTIEQTLSYSTPGGTTQVKFKVVYDATRILQSLETSIVSGDPTSASYIGNFNSDAGTSLVGQRIVDLRDVMVMGGASLTTGAFRSFIGNL
jgi:Divergent InlB B-repeat domain